MNRGSASVPLGDRVDSTVERIPVRANIPTALTHVACMAVDRLQARAPHASLLHTAAV
jgi:hypothetical protein